MIKKKIVVIILCLSLTIITICPIRTVHGKTLRDYKNELATLQQQQANNKQQINTTSSQVTAKQNAIFNSENQIKANEKAVEEAKVKIEEGKQEIIKKNQEMEDVINIMQYTNINGSEVYIDYIINSDSISEMMERQSIIDQIIDYTQEELDSLAALIKENEQLQIDLAKQNEELTAAISSYEKQVVELQKLINKLNSTGLDLDEQIKAKKDLISKFEKAGCKDGDDPEICYYKNSAGSGEFTRPLNKGVVTQQWGVNGHYGIDIGGNAPGTPVYAPADGEVYYVRDGIQYYRSKGVKSCGGHVIYAYFRVNGKKYTAEFAHLKSYNVTNGQKIYQGQQIGTVGGDGSTTWYDQCTFGTHLHYAIAYGYYGIDYSYWSQWQSNTKATSVQSISGLKNQYGWTFTNR